MSTSLSPLATRSPARPPSATPAADLPGRPVPHSRTGHPLSRPAVPLRCIRAPATLVTWHTSRTRR